MSTSPAITVITPSYNTEDELFQRAFDSMMAQTLPADQVEWIVVVHNSTDGHLAFVSKLAQQHPGMRVIELHNDKHTASSPRNCALQVARGKYITFLDADDALTPECLETIVDGMERCQGQIGKFRSERQEEGPDIVSFLDNRVRFDQTKPLIELHRGERDINKLMTMANMMMNCQVIERSHLEACGVRFREDIRIYEDIVFNMECLKDAETIVVFPQLIGYIYYMRQGSTMQELKVPSDEQLVATTRDIAKQLQIGLDAGLNMRYLFFGHMKQIADMMVAKGETMGDVARAEVRSLLAPFFGIIDPPEPDRKFLTREQIHEVRAWARSVIMGEDANAELAGMPADVAPSSEAVLNDILRDAEQTELGENWDFSTIRTQNAYAARVPITDYSFYAPMIALMTRIGESGILFSDDIAGYCVTAGATGMPQSIPYTLRSIEAYRSAFSRLLDSEGSVFLLAESIRGESAFADQAYPDSMVGATLQLTEPLLGCNSHRMINHVQKKKAITSPAELLFVNRLIDVRYPRLLFALADLDVGCIVSPFAWGLLDTFRYLELHWEELVDDIAQGTFNGGAWFSAEECARYESLLDPQPERARQLREAFEAGFEDPIVPRIWPACTKVVAVGSGDQKLYADHLRRYLGDIPLSNGLFWSTEALVGEAVGLAGSDEFQLLPGACYVEFAPVEADGTRKKGCATVVAEDVRPGELYEMLLTTRAGLYRYASGDIVQIVRAQGPSPVFRFVARACDFLPLGSLQLLPGTAYQLVAALERQYDVVIEDYAMGQNAAGDGLVVCLEPPTTALGRKALAQVPPAELQESAERLLFELQPGYADARAAGTLAPVQVKLSQPETQLAWRDRMTRLLHSAPDQVKPVHVIHDLSQRLFFKAFVEG